MWYVESSPYLRHLKPFRVPVSEVIYQALAQAGLEPNTFKLKHINHKSVMLYVLIYRSLIAMLILFSKL